MGAEVRKSGRMTTNWDNCRKRLAPRVENGIRAGADLLLSESLPLIPEDTGAAKASGHVRKKAGGLKAEFVVGYGSLLFPAAAYGLARRKRPPHMYVVYLHENTLKAHTKGQAKFLEQPYNEKRQEMVQAINAEIFR